MLEGITDTDWRPAGAEPQTGRYMSHLAKANSALNGLITSSNLVKTHSALSMNKLFCEDELCSGWTGGESLGKD